MTISPEDFPLLVTRHFASLAGPENTDPIRRQFTPDPLEAQHDPFALDDPLGEAQFRITPRFVRQYKDRALLLAGGSCAVFCRYCFRKLRMSYPAAFISQKELEPVVAFLKGEPDLKEILVSGGDPLCAGSGDLEGLFHAIRGARPDILIRLCSRVPIVDPQRLTSATVALLSRFKPMRMAVHINHPRELAPAARHALVAVLEAGIPVLVQTVLLRGVNDNAKTLADLFRQCLDLGLSPYYLFQLDLAPGAAHFRVPLKDGLSIYRDVERFMATGENAALVNSQDISVPGLPVYALDLPGGGGKIQLNDAVIAGEEERPAGRVILLKDKAGKLWEYPAF